MNSTKPHFSDSLAHFNDVLTWAQNQDVDGLRSFLLSESHLPLLGISSGGASSPLHYACLMYGTANGIGRAITPLEFASISDNAVKNSKVLILSNSGHGVDPEYTGRRAFTLNPGRSACITTPSSDNVLIPRAEKTGASAFIYDWPSFGCTGFVSSLSHIATFGLFYKAFTGDSDFASKLAFSPVPESNFVYRTRVAGGEVKPLGSYKHYIVLYGGYGEPAAIDLETKFHESGIASVQLADYRNFTHGRFIFESNNFDDTCIVLLRTPREKKFSEQAILEAKGIHKGKSTGVLPDLFPADMPVVIIDTEHDSPLASIDLLMKSQVFFSAAADSAEIEPFNPSNPKKIDKRALRQKPFPGIAKATLQNDFEL